MTVTVPFDESDISKLKVGQPATVTFDALTGVELAAKVSSISTIGTTSDSVVSYDATLTLTQRNAQVKPGMTASVAVIDKQASGVTLPNSAVPGTSNTATVNVTANGKTTPTEVIVGVRGDSRTQIVKGLTRRTAGGRHRDAAIDEHGVVLGLELELRNARRHHRRLRRARGRGRRLRPAAASAAAGRFGGG